MQGSVIKTIGLILIAIIVAPIIGSGLLMAVVMIIMLAEKYGAIVGFPLTITFLAILWFTFVAILKFIMTKMGIEE